MLALSVHQPYAELILRGIKRIEYRSRATRIIGERFYLYATRGGAKARLHQATKADEARRIWSDDLAVPGSLRGTSGNDEPPAWMLELAELLILDKLPRGMIVGSAVIDKCDRGSAADGHYHWHLSDVQRLASPIKPSRHPQPAWFRPF